MEVHGSCDDGVTPPGRRADVVERKGEEDDQGAQGQAQVQGGGCQEVQPAPPAKVVFAHPVLEDEADDAPAQVVERRGRRDGPRAAKDERGHQELDGRPRPAAGCEVDDDGHDGAEDEEGEQARVDLAGGEDASRAQQTPDDRGWIRGGEGRRISEGGRTQTRGKKARGNKG